MSKLGERAVVCGASMAGLLAARVLSDFYGTVTLVERDRLPDGPAQRRGVPQGRHLHALLTSGSQVLGRLFPGLLDELAAAGATVCDEGDLSRVSVVMGGHQLNRSGRFADPGSLVGYVASRPFLESHVRRRVRAIQNVTILDGHDVVEPIAGQPNRITGARVANRDTGAESVLDAELVIDAMGRGARTPAFLDNLGYDRPAEQCSAWQLSYSSQFLRIPADMVTEKMTMIFPTPEHAASVALLAYEHDTWILTMVHLGGHQPTTELAEMISLAAEVAPPALVAALRAAEPVGEVSEFRYPPGVFRRYDKMDQFPAGLLPLGDAICSFNPLYGQGMTLAALEAEALGDCLADGDADLARRFFTAAANHVGATWVFNQAIDRYMSSLDTRRSALNWRIEKVMATAENDAALSESLFRVLNLVDPPMHFLRPMSQLTTPARPMPI